MLSSVSISESEQGQFACLHRHNNDKEEEKEAEVLVGGGNDVTADASILVHVASPTIENPQELIDFERQILEIVDNSEAKRVALDNLPELCRLKYSRLLDHEKLHSIIDRIDSLSITFDQEIGTECLQRPRSGKDLSSSLGKDDEQGSQGLSKTTPDPLLDGQETIDDHRAEVHRYTTDSSPQPSLMPAADCDQGRPGVGLPRHEQRVHHDDDESETLVGNHESAVAVENSVLPGNSVTSLSIETPLQLVGIERELLELVDSSAEKKVRLTMLPGLYRHKYSKLLDYKMMGFTKLKKLLDKMGSLSVADGGGLGKEYLHRKRRNNTNLNDSSAPRTNETSQAEFRMVGMLQAKLADIERNLVELVDDSTEKKILLSKLPSLYKRKYSSSLNHKKMGYDKLKDLLHEIGSLSVTASRGPGTEYLHRKRQHATNKNNNVGGSITTKSGIETLKVDELASIERNLLEIVDSRPNNKIRLYDLPGLYQFKYAAPLDHKKMGHKKLKNLLDEINSLVVIAERGPGTEHLQRSSGNPSDEADDAKEEDTQSSSPTTYGDGPVDLRETRDGSHNPERDDQEEAHTTANPETQDHTADQPESHSTATDDSLGAAVNVNKTPRNDETNINTVDEGSRDERTRMKAIFEMIIVMLLKGQRDTNSFPVKDIPRLFFEVYSQTVEIPSENDFVSVLSSLKTLVITESSSGEGLSVGLVQEDDYFRIAWNQIAANLLSGSQLRKRVLIAIATGPEEGVTTSHIMKNAKGFPFLISQLAGLLGLDWVSPAIILEHLEGVEKRGSHFFVSSGTKMDEEGDHEVNVSSILDSRVAVECFRHIVDEASSSSELPCAENPKVIQTGPFPESQHPVLITEEKVQSVEADEEEQHNRLDAVSLSNPTDLSDRDAAEDSQGLSTTAIQRIDDESSPVNTQEMSNEDYPHHTATLETEGCTVDLAPDSEPMPGVEVDTECPPSLTATTQPNEILYSEDSDQIGETTCLPEHQIEDPTQDFLSIVTHRDDAPGTVDTQETMEVEHSKAADREEQDTANSDAENCTVGLPPESEPAIPITALEKTGLPWAGKPEIPQIGPFPESEQPVLISKEAQSMGLGGEEQYNQMNAGPIDLSGQRSIQDSLGLSSATIRSDDAPSLVAPQKTGESSSVIYPQNLRGLLPVAKQTNDEAGPLLYPQETWEEEEHHSEQEDTVHPEAKECMVNLPPRSEPSMPKTSLEETRGTAVDDSKRPSSISAVSGKTDKCRSSENRAARKKATLEWRIVLLLKKRPIESPSLPVKDIPLSLLEEYSEPNEILSESAFVRVLLSLKTLVTTIAPSTGAPQVRLARGHNFRVGWAQVVAHLLCGSKLQKQILETIANGPEEGVTINHIKENMKDIVYRVDPLAHVGSKGISLEAVLQYLDGVKRRRNRFCVTNVGQCNLAPGLDFDHEIHISGVLDSRVALECHRCIVEAPSGLPQSGKKLKRYIFRNKERPFPVAFYSWVATINKSKQGKQQKAATMNLLAELHELGLVDGTWEYLDWSESHVKAASLSQEVDEQDCDNEDEYFQEQLVSFDDDDDDDDDGSQERTPTFSPSTITKLIDSEGQLAIMKAMLSSLQNENPPKMMALNLEGPEPDELHLIQIAIGGGPGSDILVHDCDCLKIGTEAVCDALREFFEDSGLIKLLHGCHNHQHIVTLHNTECIKSLEPFIDTQVAMELLTGNAFTGFDEMLEYLGVTINVDGEIPSAEYDAVRRKGDLIDKMDPPPRPLDAQLLLRAGDALLHRLEDLNQKHGSFSSFSLSSSSSSRDDNEEKKMTIVKKLACASKARLANVVARNYGSFELSFDTTNDYAISSREILEEFRPEGLFISDPLEIFDNDGHILVGRLPQDLQEMLLLVDCPKGLTEIVLDKGRPACAWIGGKRVFLGEKERVVSTHDIEMVIKDLDFDEENRAGVDEQLHKVCVLRNVRSDIIGVSVCIGRHVRGNLSIVADLLFGSSEKSILFVGPKRSGKTTVIREAARMLAERCNVMIVDKWNEVAGSGDVPHPCIGLARRMMVPLGSSERQRQCEITMMECAKNHAPDVMVLDEIDGVGEVEAVRRCKARGIRFVASAACDLKELVENKDLCGLVGGMETTIFGERDANGGGYQGGNVATGKSGFGHWRSSVRRVGRPLFDVVVEFGRDSFDEWRVVHNVAEAVDKMLVEEKVFVERRIRDGETGSMRQLFLEDYE